MALRRKSRFRNRANGNLERTVHRNGNLTVNSGQTLTLAAGTKIAFANNTSLTVNGTLAAIGTGVSPIVCDRFGPSGTWAGIVINSGGVGNIQYCNISHASPAIHLNGVTSSQTVKNCNITNCTNYGIRISNSGSSYKDISNNTIDNVAYAIYLNNASAAIDQNTINNTSYQTAYGIYSYGGGGSWCITNNTITAYDAPLYADYYSTLLLLNVTYGTGGHNKTTTGGATLVAGYNSVIEAGGYGGIQGLNSFYGGGIDAQVVATGYSTVVAQNNWWGDDGYSESRDQTSTIAHEPDLGYDPNGGMGKISAPVASGGGSQVPSQTTSPLSDPPPFDFTLTEARQRTAQGNYDNAIMLLSEELKSKAGLAQKKYALAPLRACFDQAKRTDFADFLATQVRPALSKADELYVETLELEEISLVDARQYALAAGVAETIKSDYPDWSETYKHALFNLVMLYGGELADNAKAKENLDELKAKYPGDKLTWHGATLFGEQITAPEQAQVEKEEPAPTPERTALLSSYPNPFNPTTTLRYALGDGANVSLVVYDVVGRQVAVLASGYRGPGYHAAQWMASSAASGVYFARLTVTDDLGRIVYRKTNKLLLAK